MFISSLVTIVKLWNQPRCPTTNEWIKKMGYVYTRCPTTNEWIKKMGYVYSATKMDEI
jgi:hypothetical protein